MTGAGAASSPAVHCDFCGVDFPEHLAGRSACSTCIVGQAKGIGSCGFRKCPSCGYEIPVEPKWIRATRRLLASVFGRGTARLGA